MTVASYFRPSSLPEALDLLAAHGPELMVIAGGTASMALINEGVVQPTLVMGLRATGLEAIERVGDELRIGATATLTRLAEQTDIPMLADAARHTAGWSIRNMATIGGNLFTPPPGGDVATALLALDARLTLASNRGERTIALTDFFTGHMTTALAADELVTTVVVSIDQGQATFVKFGRRRDNTPAVVTVAACATMDAGNVTHARIALGAAGPHPMRIARAEVAIDGRLLNEAAIAQAAAIAEADCEPFTDAVASAWYRRKMVGVFVARALSQLAAQHAESRS